MDANKFEYLLRQGDNALILSQQLSQLCGKGPALEEDMALTNVALDLLGQTRMWLTYAGEIEGRKEPTIISMLDWPGPFSQYHASNSQPHWIVETMLTKKEPFNAERLLLSSGIVAYNMESNWENGRFSAVGRRMETPFMNMKYRSVRGPQFNTGERPPNVPYIRGFAD